MPDPRPSPAPGQEEKAAWDALHLAIHWGISQFASDKQVWKVWNELRRAGYTVVPSRSLPVAGLSEEDVAEVLASVGYVTLGEKTDVVEALRRARLASGPNREDG